MHMPSRAGCSGGGWLGVAASIISQSSKKGIQQIERMRIEQRSRDQMRQPIGFVIEKIKRYPSTQSWAFFYLFFFHSTP
jgi:hypothetical protein